MNEDMYHIGLCKNDVEGISYAILPGDPGRVELIASFLKNSFHVNTAREYTSYIGYINKEKVLVISTGMGGPSTAICIEELHMLGIKSVIRVGTCGGMQLDVNPGDIILAESAVRAEGTSREYLPIEVPAIASYALLNAAKRAIDEKGLPHHIGVVHSKDSFYGQHSPERMPVYHDLKTKWKAYIKAGVLASEMETAALYAVCNTLGVHCLTILLVIWNQEQVNHHIEKPSDFDTTTEIKIAIRAIELLTEE